VCWRGAEVLGLLFIYFVAGFKELLLFIDIKIFINKRSKYL
jgi:hypothetical protein